MVKNYVHLPISLVETIKSDPDYRRLANSLSVNDEFYAMKIAILDRHIKEIDANTLHSKIRLGEDYPAHAKLAFLHFAASTGDLLAAHEIIYLGSNIDVPDLEGYTPLHLAVHTIRCAQFNKSSSLKHARASRRRIVKVIRLLLEHHADVNLVLEGQCPLTHACMIKDWELIELFAKYGANPAPPECYVPPSSFLQNANLISLFNAIFERYAASPFVRGPRPCPCFSGLPLAECHAKEDKAYPPDFLCFCVSEKRFGTCCSRRNVFAYEQWNESHQRIEVSLSNRIPPDPLEQESTHPMYKIIERVQKMVKMTGDGRTVDQFRHFGCRQKIDSGFFTKENSPAHVFECVENMALNERFPELRLDPAFRYALKKVDFRPWPTGRQQSKALCLDRQTTWNALVDEYIETSGDSRAKLDIERGAKLGISLGALYRVCENEGCDVMEGDGVPTHKLCGGCKITVYCSTVCQRAAWKTHKKVCGKLGLREQALPSQEKLDKVTWERFAERLEMENVG